MIELTAHELIVGYWEVEEARYLNSEVSILTIRLGLTAATAFMKMCDFEKTTSQLLVHRSTYTRLYNNGFGTL